MTRAAVVPPVAELLARAVELGRTRAGILADPANHRLSRSAWDRLVLELGWFSSLEQLEKLEAEIMASCPYLWRAITIRAELWRVHDQDRPAIWSGFGDGDRDPAAYAERVGFGISVEQCSAVAARRCGSQRPDNWFGRLGSFGELDDMLAPLAAELAGLDRALGDRLRLADLEWIDGRPLLVVGGYSVMVGEDTLPQLATLLAELVTRPVPKELAA
jgi:hypothetical protein